MKRHKFKVGFLKSDALEYETVLASAMDSAEIIAAARRIRKGKPSDVVSCEPIRKKGRTSP